MEGTVKLCVPPDDPLVDELVGCGELVACADFVGCAVAVAVTEGLAVAEWTCFGECDGDGDAVSADVGDPPGAPASAPADPPVAAGVGTADGLDELAPHAVRPAPAMTATMITAGTRRILMLLPSDEYSAIYR
jgi:hypothetical protein